MNEDVQRILADLVKNKDKIGVNIDSIVLSRGEEQAEHVWKNSPLHQLRSCSKILVAFAYGILIGRRGGDFA